MALPPGGTAVLNAADPSSEFLAEVVPDGARVVRYAVPSRGVVSGDVLRAHAGRSPAHGQRCACAHQWARDARLRRWRPARSGQAQFRSPIGTSRESWPPGA